MFLRKQRPQRCGELGNRRAVARDVGDHDPRDHAAAAKRHVIDVAALLVALKRPAEDPEVEARGRDAPLDRLDPAPDLHAVQRVAVRVRRRLTCRSFPLVESESSGIAGRSAFAELRSLA